jgi:kynurenine formamidase
MYLRKKKMRLHLNPQQFIETDQPLDISMPLRADEKNVRAWYVDPPRFEPVRANGFIGSIEEGGAVNFRDIYFNPHGHGTHTECLGHITNEIYSINQLLQSYFCKAQLISVEPQKKVDSITGEMDLIITNEQLESIPFETDIEALIIRTLPNDASKCGLDYSATNPAYLAIDCIKTINQLNIKHLLIDLPSVDRESDGGELAFHHAFWGVPDEPNFQRTITELIYVTNSISDGMYILELQVAPFENDASPSRPVLYALQTV